MAVTHNPRSNRPFGSETGVSISNKVTDTILLQYIVGCQNDGTQVHVLAPGASISGRPEKGVDALEDAQAYLMPAVVHHAVLLRTWFHVKNS